MDELDGKVEKINKACERFGSNQYAFSERAVSQMDAMVKEVQNNNPVFDSIASTKQSVTIKGGFAAEVTHKETFNLDAILKNKSARAYTDKDIDWSNYGYRKNDNPDIIVSDNNQIVVKAQSKFYKDAESTAKALRETKNGQVKYDQNDQYIVPLEQVEDVKKAAHKTQTWENGKTEPRQEVVDATQQVQDKTTGQLEHNNVKSRPLTSEEAKELGKDGSNAETRKSYINKYETQSTLQQMKTAAIGAFAVSAAVSGIANTVVYAQEVKKGTLSPQEASYRIAMNLLLSGTDSAAKAAISAGVVSTLTRKGILTSTSSALAKGGVTTSVQIAVDFAKNLVLFLSGKISLTELKERTAKECVFGPATLFGNALGTSIASSLGFGSTASAILGGIPGGMLISTALQVAIENGIEKPYRELLANSAQIKESLADINRPLQEIDSTFSRIDLHIMNARSSMNRATEKQKTIESLLRSF